MSLAKKKKRSRTSPPPNRHYKKRSKKSKKHVYNSGSSSLSEGEIADDEPNKIHKYNRPIKKYGMSDDSMGFSSNDSNSRSKGLDNIPGLCI